MKWYSKILNNEETENNKMNSIPSITNNIPIGHGFKPE